MPIMAMMGIIVFPKFINQPSCMILYAFPAGLSNEKWAITDGAISIQYGAFITSTAAEGIRCKQGDVPYSWSGLHVRHIKLADKKVAVLEERVAFFIPEHVSDPSRRPPGEQLWVEATVPKKGPPRPIRLGVKKEGVSMTPLDLE